MYTRPPALNDYVYDFGPGVTNKLGVVVFKNSQDNNIVYTMLNTPTVSSASVLPFTSTSSTTNGINYMYARPIPAPGYYRDWITWYYLGSSNQWGGTSQQTRQTMQPEYWAFQKSILALSNNGNVLIKNNTVQFNINTDFIIDGSNSRGLETVSMNIQYKDSSNNWVTAVSGVDVLLVGAIGSYTLPNVTLRFLRVANFRITFNSSGFTSYNNPYTPIDINKNPRVLVTENTDTFAFYVEAIDPNSGGGGGPIVPPVSPQENIVLPKINCTVTPAVLANTSTTITTYATVNIAVSPDIQFNTGTWTIGGTPVSKTNQDWLDEIGRAADVNLYITRTDGTLAFPVINGLNPTNVILTVEGNYLFNYVMTLKP